jgi:uncharacterized damage-inducible protein DinB
MISLLQDLVAHKGHANAALLAAVQNSAAAAADREILDMLNHILVANRFWLSAIRGGAFVAGEETTAVRTLPALVDALRDIHEGETAWLSSATLAQCEARVTNPLIPGGSCSVAEAIAQVCMHSHGHRAQLAKLLRGHGVEPPRGDFILWLTTRQAPNWDAGGHG